MTPWTDRRKSDQNNAEPCLPRKERASQRGECVNKVAKVDEQKTQVILFFLQKLLSQQNSLLDGRSRGASLMGLFSSDKSLSPSSSVLAL